MLKKSTCRLSCLMVISASDRYDFLNQALLSIYEQQTRPADEYVLVCNGPLDKAVFDLLLNFKKMNHSVVKLVNRVSMGVLSDALNDGLDLCTGDFVARMDPDDISISARFAKQLDASYQNPNIDIWGSWIGEFEYDPQNAKLRRYPQEQKAISATAKWRNPLAHSSVMFRKKSISDLGGYPDVGKAQDYLLWVMAIKAGLKLANIEEPLLLFRSGKAHMNRRGWSYFIHEVHLFRRMRDIDFISLHQFYLNIFLRGLLRFQPNYFRRLIYKIRR